MYYILTLMPVIEMLATISELSFYVYVILLNIIYLDQDAGIACWLSIGFVIERMRV